jgi:hypothetical protein
MSSPILPAQGPTGPPIENRPANEVTASSPADAAASTAIGDVGAFIDQLAAGVSALNIAASPSREADRIGPPSQVLDQIAVAGRIGEQLREAGQELRFFPAADGGRVRIEVHDRDGNAIGNLSPAAALELAAGSPLN